MASSIAKLSKRTMRIYALPLTPLAAARMPSTSSRSHSVQDQLTYYHFVTPPPKQESGKSWAKWVTTKAANTWASFGQAPEKNWKVRCASLLS